VRCLRGEQDVAPTDHADAAPARRGVDSLHWVDECSRASGRVSSDGQGMNGIRANYFGHVRHLVSALAWLVLVALGRNVSAGDPSLGKQIFREGILGPGETLKGSVERDVEIRGRAAACATCHRQSGFGSNEGSSIVPAITGPTLFTALLPRRADLFRGLYL